MAILTPVFTKWIFAPIFRRWIEYKFAKFDHVSNILLMVLVLSAFISIAAYAGTSVLFGAFLAGTFLTYLPSKHPDGPFVVMSREEGEQNADKSPKFIHTFELYLWDTQKYLMEPLFFASIGFAIPFVELWTGKRIWRGILFTLLMAIAKVRRFHPLSESIQGNSNVVQFIVGLWIPFWNFLGSSNGNSSAVADTPRVDSRGGGYGPASLAGLLLGSAMVARGEIGLLIIEIGYNETSYVSQEGLITAVWAILLNTIIGPVIVGYLVKYRGTRIGEGEWGLQSQEELLRPEPSEP